MGRLKCKWEMQRIEAGKCVEREFKMQIFIDLIMRQVCASRRTHHSHHSTWEQTQNVTQLCNPLRKWRKLSEINTAPSLRSRLEMMNALMRLGLRSCLCGEIKNKRSRSESSRDVGKNQNSRLRRHKLHLTPTMAKTWNWSFLFKLNSLSDLFLRVYLGAGCETTSLLICLPKLRGGNVWNLLFQVLLESNEKFYDQSLEKQWKLVDDDAL